MGGVKKTIEKKKGSGGGGGGGVNLTGFFQGVSGCKREDFTRRVVDHFVAMGCNVFVAHRCQVNRISGKGPLHHKHFELSRFWGTCGFDVYWAERGVTWTATNLTDGGFINWCFG